MKKYTAVFVFVACALVSYFSGCVGDNGENPWNVYHYCDGKDQCSTCLSDAAKWADSVRYLYLSPDESCENSMDSIPVDLLSRMPNLREIWLTYPGIKSIPPTIGKLKQLRRITFGVNIVAVPDEILQLDSLFTLNLTGQISVLPDSIGKMQFLSRLDVSNNKLVKISESIGSLSGLVILGLSDNLLTELPSSIGNLTSLEKLWLSNNRLTELPESMKNLHNLTTLELDGNPFSEQEKTKIRSWFPGVEIKF